MEIESSFAQEEASLKRSGCSIQLKPVTPEDGSVRSQQLDHCGRLNYRIRRHKQHDVAIGVVREHLMPDLEPRYGPAVRSAAHDPASECKAMLAPRTGEIDPRQPARGALVFSTTSAKHTPRAVVILDQPDDPEPGFPLMSRYDSACTWRPGIVRRFSIRSEDSTGGLGRLTTAVLDPRLTPMRRSQSSTASSGIIRP